jgi:hypothetical protein
MTTVEWTASGDPEKMLVAIHEARIGTERLPVVLAGFVARGRLIDLLSPALREPFAAYARWAEGRGPRPDPARWGFDPLARHAIDVWDADDCVRDALGGCEYWLGLISAVRAEACGERRGAYFSRPPTPLAGTGGRRMPCGTRWAIRSAHSTGTGVGPPRPQ